MSRDTNVSNRRNFIFFRHVSPLSDFERTIKEKKNKKTRFYSTRYSDFVKRSNQKFPNFTIQKGISRIFGEKFSTDSARNTGVSMRGGLKKFAETVK